MAMPSDADVKPSHRNVASIRSSAKRQPPSVGVGLGTPHTPRLQTTSRTAVSTFGSPLAIRADDDFLIIEIGSRFIRAGFAGDSLPKAELSFGPEDRRRVGDFGTWLEPGLSAAHSWVAEYELWRYDVRDLDMGLFRDKMDRLLRSAFTRHLLIDSRPRKMGLVLDSSLPLPLLSSLLGVLFNRFQAPSVSLLPSATMSAVAAGVRSALVIDMGWSETVVTSIYEYREVKSTRSVRGGKNFLNRFYELLRNLVAGQESQGNEESRVVSFDESEEIMRRLAWCRPISLGKPSIPLTHLDTVEERDETEEETMRLSGVAEVPLRSASPPTVVRIPFERLADVCDESFFGTQTSSPNYDDHELPIPLLVYRHLLRLPLDVRAICMSRILFTGGCSNVIGIKGRIVDEVQKIVDEQGWTFVKGKGVNQLRDNMKVWGQAGDVEESTLSGDRPGLDGERAVYSEGRQETDEAPTTIEAKIERNRPTGQQARGRLRAIHSLGSWTGASLLCQLKVAAMATIEREGWLQQGINGASRPGEIDVRAQQRQSIGAGGLVRGSSGHSPSWTLGIWGSI